MTRFSLLLLVTLSLLLPAQLLTAEDVMPQSNRSKFEQLKDFSLKGDAKSSFRQFRRKAEYFGSIYVNRPERLAGSFSNVNSIELADYYARAACHAKSKNPRHCVLYARVTPKNFTAPENGETLSRDANSEFKEYLRLQNGKRFGAFAVSDNGAVGYSWAEPSRDFAEKEALKRCAKSALKLMRDVPKLLKPVVAAPSRQGCRLIHLSR